MKRSLVSALASLLLAMDVRAAEPRWTVEFKEGAYTFLTATGLEVGQKTGPGAIAGYLVVKLPPDVDPATTNRGVFLGRVRVPERRVTWLKGDEFAAGELLPAHHLIAITPNAGFEPGLWAVKVRDTVKDRSGRPVNPTNATWTVEIGEPRARPDDPGPARNTLKLKFTTEVDPATYADGIVVEKQVAGNWQEEQRGSATIAPSAHGGSVNEIGLRPLGGWERGATYRVRVTDAIRDVRGQPLTNAEDFSFTVPKSGPFETRHEPRRPVAQASAQAAAAGPAFPGGQALGWHGHWTDPVTGLIYMRHRWYDPRTGTFLSPDPLEDIDSPNQYLFGAGRPHEVVDPLGLCLGLDKEGRPCGYYADKIDEYLVETAKLRRDQTGVPLAIDRLLLSPVTGFLRLGEAQGRLGYRYAEALTNPRVALPAGATVTSETNEVGADLLQAAGDAALLAPITRSGAAGAKVSLGMPEGSALASAVRVPLTLQAPKALPALPPASVESAIASSYQQFINEAAQAVVVSFNRGEIPVPAGVSWQTILGQRIDAAARTRLRDLVRSLGIPEGPGTDVLINRRLTDPAGSGRFRIPDLRLVKSRRILDGTIGAKDSSTSQVKDFEMFSLGDTVEIVRPQVGPLQVPR
ncbi:MAG TPA: RHS repeat-associated core domain-containing protein [Thermoanaerobaculia bacterium]|nr:RHS repeat-associated core domain-containing protein [Thermoanaerobaculia bacterium]